MDIFAALAPTNTEPTNNGQVSSLEVPKIPEFDELLLQKISEGTNRNYNNTLKAVKRSVQRIHELLDNVNNLNKTSLGHKIANVKGGVSCMITWGEQAGWKDPYDTGEVKKLHKYITELDKFLYTLIHNSEYMTEAGRLRLEKKGPKEKLTGERLGELPLSIEKIDKIPYGARTIPVPDEDWFDE